MKHLFSLALAVLPLAASAASPAASTPAPSAPQDVQAPVPATTYRSAFAGYRHAAEDEATPDQTWRAVNEKVGKAGGHRMKMEGHKMPTDKPSPKPAAQPAQPAQQHQHEGH